MRQFENLRFAAARPSRNQTAPAGSDQHVAVAAPARWGAMAYQGRGFYDNRSGVDGRCKIGLD